MKKRIKILFWSMQTLFIINPFRFILGMVIAILTSIVPIILASYTGKVIDDITKQIQSNESIIIIMKPIFILGVLFLSNTFLFYGNGIITSALNIKVETILNEKFVNVVKSIPLKKFDDSEFYDEFVKAKEGYSSMLLTNDNIFSFIGEISALISIFGVLLKVFPIMIPLTFISFLIGYRLNMTSKRSQHNFWEETTGSRRFIDYLTNVFTSKEYAKEVRSFDLLHMLFQPWQEKKKQLRDKSFDINKKANVKFAQYQLFMDLISLLILCISIFFASRGWITLGEIIVLWQLSKQALYSVQTLNNAYSDIYYNNEKIAIAKTFLQNFQEIENNEKISCASNDTDSLFYIDNISFSYNKEKKILENLSLKIKEKEMIAIVGENGSGKSTLIKLLLGLYKPDVGNIYIDGINTTELEEDYTKKNIGVAFQDFVCYPFTIRENIGYGAIDKLEDDTAIYRAAEKGGVAHIIAKARNLSQVLGKTLEDTGMELSGGEWQRIALSRANMNDKPIMIFDEPASKLDPIAELRQFKQIKDMLSDRTAILVSHRIGFARLANRIIVLKNGKIVEDGTHEDLQKRNGEYKRLLSEQSKWYDLEWERGNYVSKS